MVRLGTGAVSILGFVTLSMLGAVWCDCSNCAECIGTSGICASCPPGSWGFECDRMCTTDDCMDNICDQFSGRCPCRTGLYGMAVSRGQVCIPCPENCKACVSQSSCTECVDGWFGNKCENTCSEGCRKCIAAWSGAKIDRCLQCLPGLYGPSFQCEFNCSNCKHGLCSQNNCSLGCIDGYYQYQSNCVRCFPSCESCDTLSWENQTCLTCSAGKWGNLCDKTCPTTCLSGTCSQKTGQCECKTGQYLDSNLCRTCPANCIECKSSTKCTVCIDGKYGDTCEHECNTKCLSCETKSDQCTSCSKGDFLRDNSCFPCEGGCSECRWLNDSNAKECMSCLPGNYLDKEDGTTVLKCLKCAPGCSNCDINGKLGYCQRCSEGYFPYRNLCCPNNCTACSATYCSSCMQGLYGWKCDVQCNEKCLTCKGSETCNTCKPDHYSISTSSIENFCECSTSQCVSYASDGSCSTCKQEGWYPRNADCCQCHYCKDLKCDKQGNCLNGCSSREKFGAKCDISCFGTDIHCSYCIGQSVESMKCVECVTKFYYISEGKCVYCPSKCKDRLCGERGVCKECEEGWAGDQCTIECGARCKVRCDQYGCPECKDGYFGEYCQELCAVQCGNNNNSVPVCYNNGVCHNCLNGYWGKRCNQSCSEGCLQSICDQKNGQCIEGCIGGFHGHMCDTKFDTSTSSVSSNPVTGRMDFEITTPRNPAAALSTPEYNILLLLSMDAVLRVFTCMLV